MEYTTALKKLRFKYPDAKVVAFPSEWEPLEVVCEVEPTRQHPDYSVAVAIIEKSAPHHHEVATELYEVLSGRLDLHLGQRVMRLYGGQSATVPPGEIHWAESEDNAWVRVTSRPGWTREDHILQPPALNEEAAIE